MGTSVLKKYRVYVTLLLLLIILATIVFRCALGHDRVFSGSDSNIGLIAGVHRALPERFSGVYSPTPALGGVSSIPFSLFNVGRWLLPPEVFSNTWYGFYLVFSSLFMIGYLRLWKIKWPACLVGALVSFWVGSITLSAAGHLNKLGVMMLFTLALFLLEKGVRAKSSTSRLAWALGGGVSVGFMLLEQQDVALLAGLFLAPYVVARLIMVSRVLRSGGGSGGREPGGYRSLVLMWASLLLPVILCGIMMSATVATKAYKKNVTDAGLQSDSEQKWDFITQWSMVPEEWPDLIAPGYAGWSTGNPKGPYWGKVGRSRDWEKTGAGYQNFRLDSLYIGVIPLLLAFVAMVQAFGKRRADGERSTIVFIWGIFSLMALLLSFGKYSPVYKLFYQLPLVSNIRAPIKFLHNFQVFVGMLAAFGLNGLLETKFWAGKKAMVLLGGISLLLFFGILGTSQDQFEQWGQHADLLSSTTRMAWGHALVMVLVCLAIVAAAKRIGFFRRYGVYFLVLMLSVDSVLLTSKYFKSQDISEMRNGNPVINYLKDHQGNDRIFLMDSRGVYSRWISSDAGYHGLNIFNIWQMPRMAADLKAFLGGVGGNQLRLWQLSSVKFITAPGEILNSLPEPLRASFVPKMFYRFVPDGDWAVVRELDKPEAKGDQVLLEYRDSVPRYAFYTSWRVLPLEQHISTIFSPGFDPLRSVVVESGMGLRSEGNNRSKVIGLDAEVTRKDAVLHTDMNQPGVLMFTQRYQPVWKVEIDGEPAELVKCNYIFLGVHVPVGSHSVRFYID